ncbi:1-acyl-sn-glycerol-3-phosphate acyltransferase [Hydrogenophaga sp. 5NK40-0174]|uniref:1-acyl-sn-glycerol-3-phosphate acyltransferase n=1 Tax=Hydrogenophaga sp. 5NK40-0174 TaxID=3127649 RepID=UPI00333F6299
MLRRLGWEVHFDVGGIRRGVVTLYPHTCYTDYVVLMLVLVALDMPVSFLMEGRITRLPVIGRWLRKMGGIVVTQENRHAMVGELLARFAAARQSDARLWVVMFPEGGRREANGWFDGFYRVAQGADVPVILAALDYERHALEVAGILHMGDNLDAEFKRIADAYGAVKGFRPRHASPVQPRTPVSFWDSNGAT